jgi:PAS domain S-box-containing protein
LLTGLLCAAVMLAAWKLLSLAEGGPSGVLILLPAVLAAGVFAGRRAAATAGLAGLGGGWLMFGLPAGIAWAHSIVFIILAVPTGLVGGVLPRPRTTFSSHANESPANGQAVPDLNTLAEQERRQTFLLTLADRLRDLSTPDAIMSEVEQSLGAMLKADRIGYGAVDLDGGSVVMTRDWTAGVVSAEGRFSLESLGADIIQQLAAGKVIRISDVHADPRAQAALGTFDALQTRALMRAPVIRGGKLKAFLYAHHATVREWTDAEGALLQDVAGRTWTEIEHSRTESAIRESEHRFRAIADTAPVLIWVTGENRARAFVNQAYVDYYGADYQQAVQSNWNDLLHPDDRDRIQHESLAGEATARPFSMEARYRRHDGEYRWLRSFSRPRLDANGEVIGFVGVAFDVTEARQAETDLKRINELLEQRVDEALAEKAKAEADLMHAQKMEAVGRLTGGVAHDFNNLLTVVIGALDIMLRSPDDSARRKKLGEAALTAARRGERLTHQLLAFSRRQALRPETVDLNDSILEAEPLLKRAAGEAVELELKLRRGGAYGRVDVAQLHAALLNLVVNARHAVGERGRITIQTQSCTVRSGEVLNLEPGRYLCVSVSDNGAGMAADVAAKAFEPFFTTKSVGEGTGLGLSQVYGFARQSGGAAHITSRVGRGTRIRLYLPPGIMPDATTATSTVGPASNPKAGARLLLVEDDPGVAAMAREMLGELSLEVRTAETAAQALDVLGREQFDIMLSDVVMPGGMTGIELARRCAAIHPQMKVVLTSGYAGEDVDTALKDTPWPLLRKPYSAAQLAEVLGEQLESPADQPVGTP